MQYNVLQTFVCERVNNLLITGHAYHFTCKNLSPVSSNEYSYAKSHYYYYLQAQVCKSVCAVVFGWYHKMTATFFTISHLLHPSILEATLLELGCFSRLITILCPIHSNSANMSRNDLPYKHSGFQPLCPCTVHKCPHYTPLG